MKIQVTILGIAAGLCAQTHGALIAGQVVGIDFGGVATTGWNQLTVGGDASTAGLNDTASVTISSLVDSNNVGIPTVDFTLENNSGQIAWDFANGVVGPAPFTDASVYNNAIISNDAPGGGRPVDAGTDFFTMTFTGLDDSLTYDLAGGYDQGNTNQSFSAVWTVGGSSFTTDGSSSGSGYGELTGLMTDGSGNLEITVTGTAGNASHVTVAALTLTAVPEPSTSLLAGLAGLGLLARRRR